MREISVGYECLCRVRVDIKHVDTCVMRRFSYVCFFTGERVGLILIEVLLFLFAPSGKAVVFLVLEIGIARKTDVRMTS